MTERLNPTAIVPSALVADPWARLLHVRVYAAASALSHETYPGTPPITHATAQEIADLIGVTRPATAQALLELAAAGWIARERVGRGSITTLNPAGR